VPWVRALLRGQKIYARATATGALLADGGRVEIRYKPNDGRRYQARADNLTVVDPAPLPDETCSDAQPVDKAEGGASGAGAGARPSSKGAAGAGSRSGAKGRARSGGREPAEDTIPEGTIVVYADGACSGNPGPAGLGVVIIDGDVRTELSEYLGEGTNNVAELTAVLRALEEVDAARPMVIHTDSQYTIGVVQKGWKAKANVELVAELREALDGREDTRLRYVPGHSGVILNERADALAREAVKERKSRRAVIPKRPA
jgi:ribonuclease HI